MRNTFEITGNKVAIARYSLYANNVAIMQYSNIAT